MVAATLDLWITSQGEVKPIVFDKSIPVTDPPINDSASIQGIPPHGVIVLLGTLTTSQDNIICSGFETVNTGNAP